MAHSFRSLISAFIWLLFPLSILSAAEKSQLSGFGVRALWLQGQSAPVNLAISIEDTVVSPLEVGTSARGAATVLKGVSTGKIVRLLVKSPTLNSPPVQVGAVTLPPASSESILLVLAASDGGRKVAGLALSDDIATFPAGTVRIANFVQGPLKMKYATRVSALNPGLSSAMPYAVTTPLGEKTVATFPFALGHAEKVFYNGNIEAWAGSRTLILVSPNVNPKRSPNVQYIMDIPKADPKAG